MEYSKLVAVTGLPGLFELINSKTDGAIVRSLDDNSTRFVSSRIHNFSHLESIEIYTVRDNVNLVDVLNAMDKAGGTLPDEKDAAAIKKYFEKVYPDMDFERVYVSDMKKMVKWFSVLKKNDVEIKLSEIPEEEEEAIPEVAEVKEEKPAKKAKAAKAEAEEKAPAKPKAAAKKKVEEEAAPKPARSEAGKKAAPKKK
jgi:regulator of protease activity HflC (stomatin/prohibitin superfamily)